MPGKRRKPHDREGEAHHEKHRSAVSTAHSTFQTSESYERSSIQLNYGVAETKKGAANLLPDRQTSERFRFQKCRISVRHSYLHNGQMYDVEPDFIIHLKGDTRNILSWKPKDMTSIPKSKLRPQNDGPMR
jgi:hypothetical protein